MVVDLVEEEVAVLVVEVVDLAEEEAVVLVVDLVEEEVEVLVVEVVGLVIEEDAVEVDSAAVVVIEVEEAEEVSTLLQFLPIREELWLTPVQQRRRSLTERLQLESLYCWPQSMFIAALIMFIVSQLAGKPLCSRALVPHVPRNYC